MKQLKHKNETNGSNNNYSILTCIFSLLSFFICLFIFSSVFLFGDKYPSLAYIQAKYSFDLIAIALLIISLILIIESFKTEQRNNFRLLAFILNIAIWGAGLLIVIIATIIRI